MKNLDSLLELFYSQGMKEGPLRYFLLLLNTIYSDNLSLLIRVSEEDVKLFSGLVDQLGINLRETGSTVCVSSIYTLNILIKFTHYKTTSIRQNQRYLIDRLIFENVEDEKMTLQYFINKKFPSLLEAARYDTSSAG